MIQDLATSEMNFDSKSVSGRRLFGFGVALGLEEAGFWDSGLVLGFFALGLVGLGLGLGLPVMICSANSTWPALAVRLALMSVLR